MQTISPSFSLFLTLSLSFPLCLSLKCTHAHKQPQRQNLSIGLSLCLSLSRTDAHKHPQTHTHTHTLSRFSLFLCFSIFLSPFSASPLSFFLHLFLCLSLCIKCELSRTTGYLANYLGPGRPGPFGQGLESNVSPRTRPW